MLLHFDSIPFLLIQLILISKSISIDNQTIVLDMFYVNKSIPAITVKIGTPPQSLHVQLSTLTYYQLIPNQSIQINSSNTYLPSNSSTYNPDVELSFPYTNNFIGGFRSQDNFYINHQNESINLEDFSFFLVTKDPKNSINGIGRLGLAKENDHDNPLMNRLFLNETVQNKAFRINYKSDQKFVIGDVFIRHDTTFYREFDNIRALEWAHETYVDYWSLNLSHIVIFNDHEFSLHNSSNYYDTIYIHSSNTLQQNSADNVITVMNTENGTLHNLTEEDLNNLEIYDPNNMPSIATDTETGEAVGVDLNFTILPRANKYLDPVDKNYFWNNSVITNKIAILATSMDRILIPSKFKDELLKKFLRNIKFVEIYDDPNTSRISVNNVTDFHQFSQKLNSTLMLVFSGSGYKIKLTNLFEENPVNSTNYTMKIDFRKDIQNIYLGSVFLQDFDVVLNLENNKVGLYSDKFYNFTAFTIYGNPSNEAQKGKGGSIFKLILVVVLIGLIYYLWMERQQMRSEMMKDSEFRATLKF